ncbi:hypothetical protein ACRRTK_006594 [Alexandromys fortis]
MKNKPGSSSIPSRSLLRFLPQLLLSYTLEASSPEMLSVSVFIPATESKRDLC